MSVLSSDRVESIVVRRIYKEGSKPAKLGNLLHGVT